jgi:O-antigen biosynthesis protein
MEVNKIVCYSPSVNSLDAMGHLRVTGPAAHAGIKVINGYDNGKPVSRPIAEGDLVLIQREFPKFFSEYQKIVEGARSQGKPIVFDLDDLLFFLPENHPDRFSQYYTPSLLPMFQAVLQADLVTVSTKKLQSVIGNYNDHVSVLPNFLDDSVWQLRQPVLKSKNENLTIGFMGGNSHRADIEYLLPVILDLIARYPRRICFQFWGLKPSAELLSLPQVDWAPPFSYSYRKFAEDFQTRSADIFIAPLVDNLFNRCKSPLKFFEYSALGTPCVLSRLDPFDGVVTHNQNGMLAGSLDEWTDCLTQLIEDDELRFKLANEAQASIRENWLLSRNAYRWQEAFEAISLNPSQKRAAQETIVDALNDQLAEREQARASLTNQIAERDFQIEEKERALRVLTVQLDDEEKQVEELKRHLGEHAAQLAEKENLIQAVRQQLAQASSSNSAQVQALSTELYVIQHSRAWRLVEIIRKIRVALVPVQSRRAAFLRRTWNWLRNIGAAGKVSTPNQPQPRKKSRFAQILEQRRTILAIKKYTNGPGSVTASTRRETPEVSIIIPVYNQVEFTLACILSIVSGGSKIDYEILVVDDASTDRTAAIFKSRRINRLRYLRNATNRGFLASCNEAVKHANGKYIVLLNNDTQVQPGWLDPLLATFSTFPNVGLVGSKLIFPTGRLQEAGGVIGSDGSAENYGRGDDPQNYLYNYVREVDYVSGASIMLLKELWEKVGGFDRKYQPAYYEDVDLAYKVRKAGLKVLYQPFSQVTHFEGGTNGMDLSEGVKRYQAVNQKTFFDSWKDAIAGNGLISSTPAYLKRSRYFKSRVLYIDLGTPKPDHYAGDVLSESYITALSEAGYGVTFLPYLDLRYADEYSIALQKKGVECVYAPYLTSADDYIRQNGERFDFIVVSRVDAAAQAIDLVKEFAPNAKVIFSTVDLHFLRLLRAAQLSQREEDLAFARKAQEIEVGVIQKSDRTLVVSSAEKELLADLAPGAVVEVVPFPAVTFEPKRKFTERCDIVFLGGFMHKPNVDAVLYFAREVWPLISPEIPDARFVIGGAEAPQEISNLASNTILVKGYVKDLDEFFEGARMSVAPIRFGAGIKGKILTSLGFGVPCVATAIAAEGIGLIDGKHTLIANSTMEFVAAVINLYNSPDLWSALSKDGQEWIKQNYSREVVKTKLLDVFKNIENTPKTAQENVPVETKNASTNVETPNTAFKEVYDSLFSVASNKDHQVYVPPSKSTFLLKQAPAKLVAFYLPQFHPIPENDEWWGKGFTEWTNVSKAIPQFIGHYQPHLPGDLGFYDLRNNDILKQQVELAQKYGIYGFAFYYYWFNGKELLERPINQFYADKAIDFPFCIIWANENWTRRWDGKEYEVLIAQDHTPENDYKFIKSIKHFLQDKRYIRIGDRPVLMVYRVQLLPNPAETALRWRNYCREEGIGEIYLMAGQVYGFEDPREAGFDAAFEFPPHEVPFQNINNSLQILNPAYDGHIFRYEDLANHYSHRQMACPYELYKTVSPNWDNEPRKPGKGVTFAFSTPELYRQWLINACNYTMQKERDKRFVFINAWNEWGEGAYLEPDRRYGYAYLQNTRKALYDLGSS